MCEKLLAGGELDQVSLVDNGDMVGNDVVNLSAFIQKSKAKIKKRF